MEPVRIRKPTPSPELLTACQNVLDRYSRGNHQGRKVRLQVSHLTAPALAGLYLEYKAILANGGRNGDQRSYPAAILREMRGVVSLEARGS